MSNQSDSLIPKMMGTEHELSLVFNHRKNDSYTENLDIELFEDDEEYFNVQSIYRVPTYPDNVLWENQFSNLKILENGSLLQDLNERPLEIATPECSKPSELLAYSLAARELVCQWAEHLLENNSNKLRSVSLHERVIDSHGNTWGEHDNYSLNSGEKHWGDTPGMTPGILWLHILTRGCVSGAGHINGRTNEWALSQKLPTVTEINNKKWGSTGLHSDHERLEVRCSDKNISQWSHMMRLGSMALVMALARVGYKSNKLGFSDDDVENLSNIGAFDRVAVNKLGEIKFSHDAKIAVTIQKSLAEACLDVIEKEGLGDEYKNIAKAWYSHCEKLDKEIFTDKSIELSNFLHTDWAAKFYFIQQRLKNDSNNGQARGPFDYQSLAQDLYYDRIHFDAPMVRGKVYKVDGLGYKLNKRIKQRTVLASHAIKQALNNPPDTTRASDRVKLLKELNDKGCFVEYVEWDMIEWMDDNQSTYKHYFDGFYSTE